MVDNWKAICMHIYIALNPVAPPHPIHHSIVASAHAMGPVNESVDRPWRTHAMDTLLAFQFHINSLPYRLALPGI